MKWLVSLCLTPTSRWSSRCPPCSATPSRWTRVPSARRAPREVLPSTATARNRSRASAFACCGGAPGVVAAHAGRGRPAAAPPAARARPEQGPGQGPRVEPVQDHPDRLLIRCPVPAGDRVPRSAQPGQVGLAGPPDPLPDRGEPVVPGGGERADRDRDQAGQRVDPPLRGARVRQRFQPLPRAGGQILAVRTGLDHARTHARQCHCGHATPRSRRPQRPT